MWLILLHILARSLIQHFLYFGAQLIDFLPLQIVDRGSDAQFQAGENVIFQAVTFRVKLTT